MGSVHVHAAQKDWMYLWVYQLCTQGSKKFRHPPFFTKPSPFCQPLIFIENLASSRFTNFWRPYPLLN